MVMKQQHRRAVTQPTARNTFYEPYGLAVDRWVAKKGKRLHADSEEFPAGPVGEDWSGIPIGLWRCRPNAHQNTFFFWAKK